MHIGAEHLRKDHILRSVSRESCSELLMSLKLEEKAKFLFLGAVGKESVVAYLLESSGQYMHQEAANEFLMSESHLLAGTTVSVVLVPEGDSVISHIQDTAVRDSDTMSVTTEVADGIAISVEGLLDVRTPVSTVQPINKRLPAFRQGKIGARLRNDEPARRAAALERSHELATEHLHRSLDRDEERLAALHKMVVTGKTSARNDAVHMRMVRQILAPGVQHHDDAGLSAEITLILRKSEKRLGCRTEQKRVKQPLRRLSIQTSLRTD